MRKLVARSIILLAVTVVVFVWGASARAQVPTPTAATPSVHGGTPINGAAVLGEVGYAALRASFYAGGESSDFGIELSAPTFGREPLQGYGQSLGVDIRAPFRFVLARFRRGNGSFKVGPYFHAGRACYHDAWYYRDPDGPGPARGPAFRYDRSCGRRNVGVGANLGFVTDIALPKMFKLIVGVEQQFGLLHMRHRDVDPTNNEFAGATWVDLGLEALWRDIFFTMIMNIGAQYGSNELYYRNHALFRQMFGVGFKFN